MKKKISIADVAASLNISKTVVSLVINGKGDSHRISKETQEKVRDKVKEMNYQPNAIARGFRTGKSNTIGLIVTEISNNFYSHIANYIERLAWQHNYSVVISSTNEIVEKEIRQIDLLKTRNIDGVIISSSQKNADQLKKLVDEKIPLVLIDRSFENESIPAVSVDNFGGARIATKHLIDQGISDIAMVSINNFDVSTTRDRVNGFISAMNDHGIAVSDKRIIQGNSSIIKEKIRISLQEYYHQNDMPEAIFAMDNNLTFICLDYLQKLSIEIPVETALIGFDDLQYFKYTKPSISAIEQPIEKIAEEAFRLLWAQVAKTNTPGELSSVILPVDMKIRNSSIKFSG